MSFKYLITTANYKIIIVQFFPSFPLKPSERLKFWIECGKNCCVFGRIERISKKLWLSLKIFSENKRVIMISTFYVKIICLLRKAGCKAALKKYKMWYANLTERKSKEKFRLSALRDRANWFFFYVVLFRHLKNAAFKIIIFLVFIFAILTFFRCKKTRKNCYEKTLTSALSNSLKLNLRRLYWKQRFKKLTSTLLTFLSYQIDIFSYLYRVFLS